jgi:hypothetical protein
LVEDKMKMDLPGDIQIVDTSGPSGPKMETKKILSQRQRTSGFLQAKHATYTIVLLRTPRQKLSTRRRTVNTKSSDQASADLSNIWDQVAQPEAAPSQFQAPYHTRAEGRHKNPSVAQKLTVASEVLCSQGMKRPN